LDIAALLKPLNFHLQQVEAILEEASSLEYQPVGEAVLSLLKAGGKRLRPALLITSAMFGEFDPDKVYPSAAAIELLHTATLVHDDTLDGSTMRRGVPTLNSMVSDGVAILVGDYLFARAAVLSTRARNVRAVEIFAQVLATICHGELGQLFGMHGWNQSLESYHRRIYSKTASLFAAAAEIGAVVASLDEGWITVLKEYGTNLGMAFQIVDDLLDLSPSDITGKPVGNDLRQGTVTLPTMIFLQSEEVPQEQKNFVKDVLSGYRVSEDEVLRCVEIVASSSAVEKSRTEAVKFVEKARAGLANLPQGQAWDILNGLLDYAVNRSH
jgi:geranylgeranyl pyrophosphate synthase